MGSRRQSREPLNLPVSLCGTDSRGQAFVERVRTANISHDGALLEGVQSSVRRGDIVVLRCEENTGRFRVIWEEPARGEGRRLGLSRLFSTNTIEDPERQFSERDSYERPRTQTRRRNERYQCEVAAELRIKGVQTPMWVTSANISEGGCAVQTQVSVPNGTELSIAFWLDDSKVWAQGVVLTSLYGLGTGIKFTGISRQCRQQIAEFLARKAKPAADRREASACDSARGDFSVIREGNEPREFTVSMALDVPSLVLE